MPILGSYGHIMRGGLISPLICVTHYTVIMYCVKQQEITFIGYEGVTIDNTYLY